MRRKSPSSETLAQRHEREGSEKLPSGQQTIASGSKYEKQDVVTVRSDRNRWWQFLLSFKCTQAQSLRVSLQEWLKLREDVYGRHAELRPARAIRFYGPSKSSTESTPVLADLVELDYDDFIELLAELEHLRGLVGIHKT